MLLKSGNSGKEKKKNKQTKNKTFFSKESKNLNSLKETVITFQKRAGLIK